jgi:signal transduction histidine kinase
LSQRWSIRKRLTSWFAFSVGALLVIGGGFTAWFVNDGLQRELDLLVVEELAELTVECLSEELDPQMFQELGNELDLEHSGFQLAWRAWLGDKQQPWAVAGRGRATSFPDRHSLPADVTVTPASGIRWRYTSIEATIRTAKGPISTGLVVELMLDGSSRERDLRQTGALFLTITLIGGLLAILGGALLAGRIARMLEHVANSAAAARLDDEMSPSSLPDAPEEIRRVADAFRDSVAHMRSEHSRNLLLTAGLAHELRSPMQNMISEAEVALLRDRGDDEYRQIISNQLDEVRELAHVVDNLITLTALRDTKQLPRSESFDLGLEADLRLAREHGSAARRGVVIKLSRCGDLLIDGDREALLLMLRNLIGNAIQWTAPNTQVLVHLDGEGSELKIAVEDHGSGIPEAERARIFEPFYQGDPPAGERMGYGLGLALARAAVRSHGGTIHLEDGAQGGARFVVVLERSR